MCAPDASSALKSLIGQKEKYLHELNEFRIQALETAIAERDAEIHECRENLKKLKTDFHYNLKLIEDRDAELERYDATFANMNNALRDRDVEISELRIALDEAEGQIRAEKKRSEQVEIFCQDKLAESRERNEGLRSTKDEEIRRLRSEMDEMRRDFSRQLLDKDQTLEIQRKDMAASFDELSTAQEISSKAREETLLFEIRQKDADVLQLKKRCEALELQRESLEKRLETTLGTTKSLEKRVQELELELHEVSRKNSLFTSDLQQQIRALELAKELQKEESEAAFTDLEEKLQIAEKNLVQQKEDYDALLERANQDQQVRRDGIMSQMQARIDSLTIKLRASEQDSQELRERMKQTAKELAEAQHEHLRRIEEMQAQLEASDLEKQRIEHSARTAKAFHDQELTNLRDKVDILKKNLEEKRQDITDLRADLERSNELLSELRRENMQKDVEKDEAITAVEKKAQERASELQRSLGQQRDRAVAAEADLRRQLMNAQAQIVHLTNAAAEAAQSRELPKEQDYGTPLDSPIQMPPFPETPQIGDYPPGRWFGGGDVVRSRPATAEGHGSRPATAEGHGSRPATAEGLGEHELQHRLRLRVKEVEDQNEKLRKVVAGMRHEMERIGSAAAGDLQERVLAAEEAVRRLSAERQRLIQTCNRLRADLMRCTLGASTDISPLSPRGALPGAGAVSAAEPGGAGHADGAALQEIAQSMQELVRRNAALRNCVAPRRQAHGPRLADAGDARDETGYLRPGAAAQWAWAGDWHDGGGGIRGGHVGWRGDGRQEGAADTSPEDARDEEAATRGRRRLERVREQLGLTGRATQVRQPPGSRPRTARGTGAE